MKLAAGGFVGDAMEMPSCKIRPCRRLFVLFPTLLLAGAGACAANPSTETDSARDAWTLTVYFENDIFANTDRNYTNGVKITALSPDITADLEVDVLPEWLFRFTDLFPIVHRPGTQRNLAVSLGQNMYTPRDISIPELIEDDRPYAGWLYTSIALHARSRDRLDTVEFNIGVVGSYSFADETQTIIHRWKGVTLPEGWDHQLANEPALNLIWERKYRGRRDLSEHWSIDGVAHIGASLGNVYTYANTGLVMRIGYNLVSDFGPATIRLAGDTNAPVTAEDPRLNGSRLGFAAFAGCDLRAVARDMMLDGNLFADSHSVDKLPFVGDGYAGASLTFGSFKFTYAQIWRTKEFREQNRDHHSFGSVTLSYTF